MGRAGGGGGGSHSSGGGHSMSHSSGGHHVSSSHSRAGGGSSFSSGPSYRGSSPFRRSYGYGMSYGRSYSYERSYGSSGQTNNPEVAKIQFRMRIITMVIVAVIAVLAIVAPMIINQATHPGITHTREKVESGNAYMNDCIVDEIGWINNPSKLSTQLQDFWKKTGVQPFIYMKAYDPSLTTDDDKEVWTNNLYDSLFQDHEDVFLYVYFAKADTDDSVGYMTYSTGFQASTIMDAEAMDVFWNYLDSDWYSWDADDTDGMFVDIFNKTAKTIMGKPKNVWSMLSVLIVVIGVIVALGIVLAIMIHKRNAAAAKAEETERILKTPMQDLVSEDSADVAAKKYE